VNKKGFSLIELLVIIAIIAILAALLLPALAKSKQSASKGLCISNQKQLNYAMSQLALDTDDKIAYASAWHNEPTAPRAWVADSMSGGGRWSKWAQTERSLIWSPLFEYAGKGIYRCPQDKSTVTWNGERWGMAESVNTNKSTTVTRARSYSMNIFMGGWSGWPFMSDNQYKVHHKYADVVDPSKMFTFIEMPAESINAGNFRVVPSLKGKESIFSMDWPGVYHINGSVVSFTDAHVEFRRWLEELTKNIPEHVKNPNTSLETVISPDNRDLKWLQERAVYPDPNDYPWKGWMGGGIGRYIREWNLRDLGDSFGQPKLYDSWGWYWDDAWK